MIAEVHVQPSPSGSAEDRYAHIDAAIAVIERSGLLYEVGALGTTFEGEPDQVWATLRAVHEACLGSGADGVISNVRVAEGAPSLDEVAPSIVSLTAKFRR